MSVEELKAKGNEALQKGDFTNAVKYYSQCIELDPKNHIMFSNRSAAYLALKDYDKSLQDAEETVNIKSDWAKGYLRKGQALFYLNRLEEAGSVTSKGLELEPNNAQLKKLFEEIENEIKRKDTYTRNFDSLQEGLNSKFSDEQIFGKGGIGNVFSDPKVWEKINTNPKTKNFAHQKDYIDMINNLQKNPGLLQNYIQDQRIMATFGALLGVNVQGGQGGPMGQEEEEIVMEERQEEPKKEEPKKEEPKKEEKVIPPEILEAAKKKETGNEYYKKKDLVTALKYYNEAVELDPTNLIYRLNRAAVYLEQKEYDKCIQECTEGIEIGRKNQASFENIAKAFTRIGTAYQKQEKYKEAIQAYKDSMVEHRTKDALQKLNELESFLKKKEEEAYYSVEKSLEAKNLGNQCFKERKYIDSLSHYAEALKRNPKDHTIYSNRATSYMKMAEFGMALKDLNKCIEMDPTYVKAYDKLGQCQFHMKDYHKAIESFEKGLKIDPENKACMDGIRMVESQISQGQPDEERRKRAMNDPEIRKILSDPIMQNVLSDLQSDPKSLAKHLQNPEIKSNIEKLFAAGVLSTGKKPQDE